MLGQCMQKEKLFWNNLVRDRWQEKLLSTSLKLDVWYNAVKAGR